MSDRAPDAPAREPMTAARLQEIAARAQAATSGSWEHLVIQRIWNTLGLERLKDSPTLADTASTEHQVVTRWIHGQAKDKVAIFGIGVSWCFETPYAIHVRPDDADFVAHARTDVPDLLAEVVRLTVALADAEREIAHRSEQASAENRYRGMAVRAQRQAEAALTSLIDGIGKIAERRMGICPLCGEHWNQHGMRCPLRATAPSAAAEAG